MLQNLAERTQHHMMLRQSTAHSLSGQAKAREHHTMAFTGDSQLAGHTTWELDIQQVTLMVPDVPQQVTLLRYRAKFKKQSNLKGELMSSSHIAKIRNPLEIILSLSLSVFDFAL